MTINCYSPLRATFCKTGAVAIVGSLKFILFSIFYLFLWKNETAKIFSPEIKYFGHSGPRKFGPSTVFFLFLFKSENIQALYHTEIPSMRYFFIRNINMHTGDDLEKKSENLKKGAWLNCCLKLPFKKKWCWYPFPSVLIYGAILVNWSLL